MKMPSSPTPPSSPASSLPSSSDDSPEAPRQVSDFSPFSPSVAVPVPVSSFSSPLSSLSSSMANAFTEPTSSTNGSSSPLMASCSDVFPSDDGAIAGGSSSSTPDRISMTYVPADQCPSSSKSRLDVDTFNSCSSNNFSSEVSSSNMDVDVSPYLSNDLDSSSGYNEAGCLWGPDSSGGETGSSFSNSSQPDEAFSNSGIPSSSNWQQDITGALGETLVSRSTWHVKCSKSGTRSTSVSPHWSTDLFTACAGAADVSSTGLPDTDKLPDENASCSKWSQEDCNSQGEHDGSAFCLTEEPVNSSVDVEMPPAMCCDDSSEGAVGVSWPCDSPNSTYTDTNISPSPSSTTLNSSVSPSPWPPPSSNVPQSSATASISSTQHCSSLSGSSADASPQVMSWRVRASSSPISLTRVAPTTPPPRPPTPPCPATPPVVHLRRGHYQPTPRRSVSPQERFHGGLQSPSTVRRSTSPPRSTPPTPSRRSTSPPLHGRCTSQRRSVSPVALQQALAQPPSPSGRRRLSSRPRSARTPSPRPPRPPNSTPEPSPSPSTQHSPRPHYTKMRGR